MSASDGHNVGAQFRSHMDRATASDARADALEAGDLEAYHALHVAAGLPDDLEDSRRLMNDPDEKAKLIGTLRTAARGARHSARKLKAAGN